MTILTLCFGALLLTTLGLIAAIALRTIMQGPGGSARKLWLGFAWLVLVAPFAWIVFIIASRDPEQDKIIRERAFAADTQQAKRPPIKPKYSEGSASEAD